MGAPIVAAILVAIRAGIPAARIIAKYGKKAYNAAKNQKTVSTPLTKKQKTFLQNWKSESKGHEVNYSIRGNKLVIKNSKKEIKNFDDFFSNYKPTETFGERVPTGLTTGRLLDKLK